MNIHVKEIACSIAGFALRIVRLNEDFEIFRKRRSIQCPLIVEDVAGDISTAPPREDNNI